MIRFMKKKLKKVLTLNIIGTSNLVKICSDLKKIKLVYFSTSYVYPGKKGDYKENRSSVCLGTIMAWSKIGW